MKTISLYQRRLLAVKWDGKTSIFELLHSADQVIEDSNRIDRIDEQIILFADENQKWVGREIVGFDNSIDFLDGIEVMDFSPTQAEREAMKLESLDNLSNVFIHRSDFRFVRGKLDISGELTLDYFNSFS